MAQKLDPYNLPEGCWEDHVRQHEYTKEALNEKRILRKASI